MTEPLTPRQREIYEWIREFIAEYQYPPTFREIGAAFGIASLEGVSCNLKALEKKGWIKRDHNAARSIQIVKPPSGMPLYDLESVTALGRRR